MIDIDNARRIATEIHLVAAERRRQVPKRTEGENATITALRARAGLALEQSTALLISLGVHPVTLKIAFADNPDVEALDRAQKKAHRAIEEVGEAARVVALDAMARFDRLAKASRTAESNDDREACPNGDPACCGQDHTSCAPINGPVTP